MTASDRSDELIRAMLERRAGSPPPDWLLDRTMHAVVAARQDRARRGLAWARLPEGREARLALVAALVALALVLLGGVALASGLLDGLVDPQPHLPAVLVVPTDGSASPSADPSVPASPSGEPTATPEPPTARPVAEGLAADTLAMVTEAGDGLRVRSGPSVIDTRKLTPLLPAGTRLFVISGPVAGDGYDWYQVQTDSSSGDIDLYGWVAAADKDGSAWIKAAKPRCPDQLDGRAIAETAPMDLLVCYGATTFEVVARDIFLMEADGPCALSPGHGACTVDPSWMGSPVDLFVGEMEVGPGETGGVLTAPVVVAPEAQDAVYGERNTDEIRLKLESDVPEAQDCRFLDETGEDVGLRAHAVLECRLRLVVRAIEWDELPPEELAVDSLATIEAAGVELWSSPDEATQELIGHLEQWSMVYVDQRLPSDGPAEWYAVLGTDVQNARYGWMRAPTRAGVVWPEYVECPRMTEWSDFVHMDTLVRLACVESAPVTLDMFVRDWQAPRPDWSSGCGAWSNLAPENASADCRATPEWLATFSGIAIRRPGDMEIFAAYDPAVIDRSVFPAEETWVKVTGAWESPTSSECRVQDPATGVDLLPPEQAAIYCRSTFVITGIGPATTSP